MVSIQESYTTQQAVTLAQDLEQNSNTVLAAAIAKDGIINVSGVQLGDQVVQVSFFEPHASLALEWPSLLPSWK